MSKVKSIFKRSLAILLAMLTIMSVGLTSIFAAYTELAETGATVTYTAGEYIYIKNFVPSGWGSTTWILNNSYAYAHMWGGTAGAHDYLFELYSGTAGSTGAIYRAKVTSGGTYTNVIFTRNSAKGGPFSNVWNQTGDIVLSSNKYNCWTGFTSGGTGFTGSHYAVTPASATLSASGYTGGSGTSADPYLVPAGGSYSVTLKATKADPGMEGYGLSIDTSTAKETSNTTGTYTETKTASTTANTTFSHTGYAWNYEYSTGYYSSSKTSNTLYFKTVATAPSAPSSVKLEVLNAYAGTGTQADPYIVEPGKTINTKITCVASDAANTTGFLYNVNYTAGWATGAAGATEFLYDGLAPLANGADGEYTPYAWAYNGTAANKSAMTTGEKVYIKAAYQNVTVKFVDHDGTVIGEPQSIPYGGKATAPETNPTKTGYTFKHWSTTENGTTPYDFNTAVKSDLTLYAVWEINSYPITFVYGLNGEKSTTSNFDYNTTPTAPSATDVAVDGYTFTGWKPTISAVTDKATYTAEYTINTYNLTISGFDSTKATMTIDGQPYTADTTITKNYGETAAVVITPNKGQVLTVSGKEITYGESYEATITFNKDQTLTLGFNIKSFDVTIKQDGAVGTVKINDVEFNGSSDTVAIEYGSKNLYVKAPINYYIKSIKGNDVDYTDNGELENELSTNFLNITADCQINIVYAQMPKFDLKVEQTGFVTSKPSTHFALSVAGVNHTADGPAATVTENLYGSEYEITVTAPLNHYIPELWVDGAQVITGADSYTTPYYALTYKVNLTKETNVKIVYKYNPVVNITTYTDNKPETIVNDPIGYGNSYTIEVPKKEGYYISSVQGLGEGVDFTNGTDDSFTYTIDFLSKDVTVIANYTAVTGTINVTAGEGGTVDNAGGTVTYPTIVKATATGDASQGYEFTHWTVESAGKKDTDYKVTEKDNVIEVQILTQGTVVNVTANFANAQKIKVYTYSDSGFNRLTMTESNGTKTNTPVNNETQTTIKFGDETWYTPGEVSLTPGFNTSITAQLFGDNPLTNGTGKLVVFHDTLGWDSVYFYSSSSSLYVTDVMNKDSNAVSTKNSTAYPMTRIGTTDYWYIYTSNSTTYMAFSKHAQSNYDWLYNTEASYPYKSGTVTGSYSTNTPCFEPKTTQTWNTNGTKYMNSGSWGSIPTFKTESEKIDIKNELYDGNTWKGLDEIWIYIKSDGTYIATTVNRRQLIDYVGSSLIKRTYNNGVNDMEYKSNLWTAFKNAYTAALDASGDHTLTEEQLKTKYNALLAAYEALDVEPKIKITGSHGAEPHTDNADYYGKTSFLDITTSTGNGNIGDQNDTDYYHYTNTYIYATIDRGTTVTIQTNLESAYETDYLVYGWVVNGTEWVPATQDIKDTSLYVGTYKCDKSAIFVPIYFRKSTIANWETDSNIAKIYASTTGSSEKWGNYISAYTWMDPKSYYQFGHWTGQLMIPDTANPGMYYTFLEFKSPDGKANVSGIAFTNYGNNTPINTNARYQTYDYYEFKELKDLGYDNIVFQLKTFEGNDNYPKTSKETLSSYSFDYFRDFSGNLIDINREKVVEERTIPDPALYIVRTGPIKYTDGAGKGWGNLEGSDFYVDAYIYTPEGEYLGRCKTYELTNLEKLAKPVAEGGRNIDLTKEEYKGKPVMIDYASLTTDSGGNKRFDGEWFGTKYGLTNVTIKTEVAFQGENGTIQYYPGQNEVEGVGNAYFNGLHFQEVSHGSENHTISAIVADGNDFVGWYKATVADDGTYTIDATATPLFTERSVSTIDASADAVYVAVFKTHPEGTFTVNNYYYTYDDFKGQPMGEHLPPVFGNDTTYSIRDVKIHKIYDAYSQTDVSLGNKFAGTYTQSMENISVGDKLVITIKTTPTYTRDYVYAWYIQANEADGKINFEEVGTDAIQGDTTPGATKEFTFTYTVEAGVDTITIYSDVVHISPKVTFTYIYNNRYNQEQKYIVNHTLTDAELKNFDNLKDNEEFNTKIHSLAPFVGDLYKNVTWEIENISADATNWTLRASEDDVYTVNVNVNGIDMDPPITGKFNDTVSLYAKDVDESVTGQQGIWYLDTNRDNKFTEGEDEILGLGSYYGLVITGDVNVRFTNDTQVMNQIILADAVYGYERATDGSGNVTTNKVYVDYLISMLLNVYTGGYIDCNNNKQRDANEPIVIDEENTNAPVSLKAIEAAGYKVDYGMVHELLNTFSDATREEIKKEFYGKPSTAMSDESLTTMLVSGKATEKGASHNGALATLLYKYSAIDYNDYATNKNRVIMTFGYDNTDYYRSLYYNVRAYLTISPKDTETMTAENTMFVFSNSATLNIAEADKITNGNTTNP